MVATINPLQIALSGLRAAQAQITVTSNNIANASTDGYSRKSAGQFSTVIDGQGGGTDVGIIQRRINDVLLKDYRTQISLTSKLTTTQSYLDKIQQLHGTPDSESSLSAQLGKLKDAFAQLSNQPESAYLVNNVYTVATQTVKKFSNFSQEVVQMRNDAQSEMKESVSSINSLTQQIAQLNVSIKVAGSQLRSTAELEDQRDLAIKKLAEQVDVSTFKDTTGVITVMTRKGQLLADTQSTTVYFNPSNLGAVSYYPASAEPVMLGKPVGGTDLTTDAGLGGKLGALLELRDTTLPTYQAQIDEVAHKMATRFADEGLKLFTLPNGTIPANSPAAYTGFSQDMVVNPAITANQTLLRTGTNALSTVQDGSSELLRKIVDFTFGDVSYQKGTGTTAITTGPATLFTQLGITGQARTTGDKNIQTLGSLDTSPFINPGTNDTFSIQVGAGLPQDITITAGMTAASLVSAINTAIPGTAQLSSGGQLILTAPQDITLASGTLGATGLAELGFVASVTVAQPPSFQISAGHNAPTTITIAPTDTGQDLLDKLNAVIGITASITGGVLVVKPTEGGDINVIDGLKTPLAALGLSVSDVLHTPFNQLNLGPNGTLDGTISSATSLQDYTIQAIGLQSQDGAAVDNALGTESNYRATLEKQYLDTTGVNLDEEMALLINIQTAYTASARTISAVQKMLDDLMNSIQ